MASRQPLAITEDLTIYHAQAQKQRLLEALAATKALALDLSQVAEMDTAGLQLLILVSKEAQRANKSVRLVASSPAVSTVMALCNLTGEFSEPSASPGDKAS